MISLRVLIVTLALAVKFDSVRADYPWSSPLAFIYNRDPPYDKILVNIILQNVPAEANRYMLYYQTGTCDKNTIGQNSTDGCDVPARSEKIPTNSTITIMQKLDKSSVRIYMELRKTNQFCVTKRIMDGIRDVNANESKFRAACLNKYSNVCKITADFENQCEAQTRAKIDCSKHERLTCAVVEEVLPEDTVHQWYQKYKDGTCIGAIPPVKGNNIKFKMTFYKFDSNTYISSIMSSTHWENNLPTEESKVPAEGYKKYDDRQIKKYTENEDVSFTCPNIPHSQLGWIEPTGYKITTYNQTTITWKLSKPYNSSMFCCLSYRTVTIGLTTIVERTVSPMTVLIYKEALNQDNNERAPAKMYCTQDQRLMCEVVEELPEDTVHQWYQTDKNGASIGTIPPVKGGKTVFKMTILKFDSNTYIYSVLNSAHSVKNLRSEGSKVPLPKNGHGNYKVEHIKKYTENEQVNFTCSYVSHTQVGVIDPTGNKITTYSKTTYSWKPTKEYNGSMLCCVNYHIYTVGRKMVVERNVTNITVFINEEPVNQDDKVSSPVLPPSTSPAGPQEPRYTTTSTDPAAPLNTPEHTSAGGSAIYYIAIAAVAGIILLTSLLYVVIKKCCRKSSDPEQTLELETYASTNMVLYAELDIRPGTAPSPASTEETTYAQIIGVLRPEKGQVEK